MRLLSLALLATIVASDLTAQTPALHRQSRFVLGVHVPIGRQTRAAQVCDGSEMAGVRSRRNLGTGLIIGGLAGALLAPEFVKGTDASTALNVISAGAIAAAVGVYLRYNSAPSDVFWQNSISQIKVGETRAEDVRQCFGSPGGTTSSGSDATWTYSTSKTGFLGMGGSARSLSVTMRDGLVTKVSKSEFGF